MGQATISSVTVAGFCVEQLEDILLTEAKVRGERLFRVGLSPLEGAFFPWERFKIELNRLERSFNVIRSIPQGQDQAKSEFPSRVFFYLTSQLAFEDVAQRVGTMLAGAVDLTEIAYQDWHDELRRSRTEHLGSRGANRDRSDLPNLFLGYLAMRFDMERIIQAVKGLKREKDYALSSIRRFDEGLSRLGDQELPLLFFLAGQRLCAIPRGLVQGYVWRDEAGFRSEPARLAEAESRLWTSWLGEDSESDGQGGAGQALAKSQGRFKIILHESVDGLAYRLDAARLLCYRSVALREVKIVDRLSAACLKVEIQGESCFLLIPGKGFM